MDRVLFAQRRADCHALVRELSKTYAYVGILGADVKSTAILANRRMTDISEGSLTECGFVVKMHDGHAFFEYSLDDVRGDTKALAEKIVASVALSPDMTDRQIQVSAVRDEPLVQSFARPCDFDDYSEEQLLTFAKEIRDGILAQDKRVINAMVRIMPFTVSKLFISQNRELDQFYSWVNVMGLPGRREDGHGPRGNLLQFDEGGHGRYARPHSRAGRESAQAVHRQAHRARCL